MKHENATARKTTKRNPNIEHKSSFTTWQNRDRCRIMAAPPESKRDSIKR
jgi:hypothetical protein